jgi:hypothetical protein
MFTVAVNETELKTAANFSIANWIHRRGIFYTYKHSTAMHTQNNTDKRQ